MSHRSELLTVFPNCQSSLRALVDQGFVLEGQRERLRDPFSDMTLAADTSVDMTDRQAEVFASIDAALQQGGFQPMLLHGVTGSGKTEVYLQAMEQVVRCGRQSLVLVP